MLVLALDFDGVISDSAAEAFVVALRAYLEFHPDSSLLREQEKLEGGTGDLLREVHRLASYGRFVEAMPLGNRAEDFAVVLHAIEQNAPLGDQRAYDRHRRGLDEKVLSDFHQRFYELRTAWSERDPDGWHALLAAYPGFPDRLRRWASRVRLAIVTAKDRVSVRRLLGTYGIDDLFEAECVFDKETGVSKRLHLEALRTHVGCPYSEITFIDDKVNHLQAVADLGVRCVLSGWGYNGAREAEIARRAGYVVSTLDGVEAELFPINP